MRTHAQVLWGDHQQKVADLEVQPNVCGSSTALRLPQTRPDPVGWVGRNRLTSGDAMRC
jgi:hypothetical protein